jgi:hypothetical protein
LGGKWFRTAEPALPEPASENFAGEIYWLLRSQCNVSTSPQRQARAALAWRCGLVDTSDVALSAQQAIKPTNIASP